MNKIHIRIFALLNLVLVSILGNASILQEAILAITLFIGGMYISRKMKVTTGQYLIFAIFGALSEAFCIYFGIWEYAAHSLILVPFWLPFLWGNAALFFGFEFTRMKKKMTEA